MWRELADAITDASGQPFRYTGHQSVGGGCINTAYRIDGEDRHYFVKTNRADQLDMFQAELARVLQVNCGDIGQLSSGRQILEPGTGSWDQAQLFTRFYRGLYERMKGDGVAMRHWLRVENKTLQGVPHLLMVDENRLAELVDYVERDSRWR